MSDPSTHTTTTQWVESLYKVMGKEKAEKFITRSRRDKAGSSGVFFACSPASDTRGRPR